MRKMQSSFERTLKSKFDLLSTDVNNMSDDISDVKLYKQMMKAADEFSFTKKYYRSSDFPEH